MEFYKTLNKELIIEVQALKQLNRTYEKMITETKGELMHERSLRVQQQQCFLSLVKRNFSEMVKVLNPETNLNELLLSDKENFSPLPTEPLSTNEILENFTHSLQAVRRSLVSVSPIPKRRSTLSKSLTEDSSVFEVDSDVDDEDNSIRSNKENENLEQNEAVPSKIEVEEEIKEITNVAERLSLLAEESEEEEEEEEQHDEISALRCNTKREHTTITLSRTEDMVLRNCASIHAESIVQVSSPLSFPAPNNGHCLCSTLREFTDDSTYTQLCVATTHNETSTPQTSTRPKRKCAPSNLKERSLGEKLRNSSVTKPTKKAAKKAAKKSVKR